ncbi:hypothetical protein D187_006367 [Cystobacter fuscus DSM 2262]|uniref:Uncharacterized protein n=1 Tax=Cystobacter fuscus (strain ATCC 25194 / DSM 2262 / NBRC 100088 / M29) TaxID=1242864 RepID=S9PKH5_CYSF2|nr:hypothetical protein [Cystobacter fuscus]EPX62957.1 hypothetical protein D187_006367 [Cystobacter fuscus DSM 2262]
MAIPPSIGKPGLATLVRTTQEQGKMMGKIAEGVKSGAVTPKEAKKLLEGQQKLSASVESALADGEISADEELGLLAQSQDNHKNIKAAYENTTQDTFASESVSAPGQVRQIGAIAEGIRQGTIDPREAQKLLEGQIALLKARAESTTPEDLAFMDMSEELQGLEIELAKLRNLTVG